MRNVFSRLFGLGMVLAVTAAILAGCTTDPVVAEVGSEKIMKSEFDTAFNSYKTQYEKQYGADVWEQEENGKKKIDVVQEQILDMLIDSRLIAAKAKELNVTVTDMAVSKELENSRGYFETEAKFTEFLAEQKITLEYLTEMIRKDLLFTGLYEKVSEGAAVSDQEIEAYYTANKDQFVEVKASHILVATEAEANAVKDRLNKGEDFAALAKELSIDPSGKENGGDLGTFSHGAMVEPFDKAVFAMSPGEISGPVKSEFGYHIIQCHDLIKKSLGDVTTSLKDQLITLKKDEAYEKMIAQMKTDTPIKKYPDKLK